ncbi:unnamed protein product [Parnassius mnemosyne]|uniref:Uncharacterized protein n=1 Tax=Parnassius mnemosyne TaxID=213953 RepID=A0AAV1KV90_9NEOP
MIPQKRKKRQKPGKIRELLVTLVENTKKKSGNFQGETWATLTIRIAVKNGHHNIMEAVITINTDALQPRNILRMPFEKVSLRHWRKFLVEISLTIVD